MKKTTKKVLVYRIKKHMRDNNITNQSIPNPFPVSWRTINSIIKQDNQSFSTKTQRKLLDFFEIAYYRDGRDYLIIHNENSNNDQGSNSRVKRQEWTDQGTF